MSSMAMSSLILVNSNTGIKTQQLKYILLNDINEELSVLSS
jgi:hypothetical protein